MFNLNETQCIANASTEIAQSGCKDSKTIWNRETPHSFIFKKSGFIVGKLAEKCNFEEIKNKNSLIMYMKRSIIGIMLSAILLISCKSHQYRLTKASGTIIEMNESYDGHRNREMAEMIEGYKSILDKEMNQVVGESTALMDYDIPESLLTNFTSDVMKQYGDRKLPGGVDLAVMNVHGHRATMPKGDVTLGNLYEIYSFDNLITFLELKGSDLKRMFDAYARMGGAGISGNVKLEIKDRKVQNVTIDGKEIDENKVYKIVTLDYLADGNNGMEAFLDAVSTDNTGITLRDIMIDHVKEQTRSGNKLTSKLDGRITIIN